MAYLDELRRALGQTSDEELADWSASVGPNSEHAQVAQAEFLRRQTAAAESAASSTRKSAGYLLASVVALTLTSILNTIFICLM